MFNSGMAGVLPVTEVGGSRNDGCGNGDWWAWIILFALFGWGGNGFGWGGNGGSNSVDAAVQRGFDNQGVMNSLRGIEQGICNLGYDQLGQMNNLNTNIMQTGFGLQGAINGVSQQLADCCCENRAAIAQVRYDMATDTCALQNTLNQGFNSVNQNIIDQFCQLKMEQKDATIAEQQNLINALNLAQSQANQNQYLISQLRPTPDPAYIVPNPYAGFGYGQCNCNTGCGC